MRRMFEIKCKIPSRANVIKEAVIRSLDNDMVCEFDAVEQNNRHQTPGFREHEKQPQDAAC